MAKYANQKTIIINKKKYDKNFLQIGIDEWQEAYKKLKPTTFAIYLYLCGNKDGYHFELSPAAIENALGIKKTAYYSAIQQLEEENYIVDGNFYTSPFRVCGKSEEEENSVFEEKNSANEENFSASENKTFRKSDRVIDNRYNKDNIDNKGEASSPSGEEAPLPVAEQVGEIKAYELSQIDTCNYTYVEDDVIQVLQTGKLLRVIGGKAVSASA